MENKTLNSIEIYFEKYKYYIFLAFPLVFSFIAHSTLLTTFFWRDDFLHFYQLSNDSALNFIFMPYGGHLYIVRNMVFYGMFKLFGVYAPAYFMVVIATHLLVVFLFLILYGVSLMI